MVNIFEKLRPILLFSILVTVGLLATACTTLESESDSADFTSEESRIYSQESESVSTLKDNQVRSRDYDCGDFSYQSEAQNYFDNNGGNSYNNVDNLDADGDGVPCETLP